MQLLTADMEKLFWTLNIVLFPCLTKIGVRSTSLLNEPYPKNLPFVFLAQTLACLNIYSWQPKPNITSTHFQPQPQPSPEKPSYINLVYGSAPMRIISLYNVGGIPKRLFHKFKNSYCMNKHTICLKHWTFLKVETQSHLAEEDRWPEGQRNLLVSEPRDCLSQTNHVRALRLHSAELKGTKHFYV